MEQMDLKIIKNTHTSTLAQIVLGSFLQSVLTGADFANG